jgi:hypothetical protein
MSERQMLSATPVKVAVFVVGLAAVFAAAFGIGALVDPDTEPVAEHSSDHDGADPHGGHEMSMAPAVHLALTQRSYDPGDQDVSFQVQGADGTPVTAYDVKHEKQLHLIVLGTRELTDFQHVHPTMAADGTWSVRLRLQPGTSYRMYADGSTGGADFLATADVFTTGGHPAPQPLPEPATTDQVDGYTVELDQADGSAALRVSKGGQPVALEPYLGALGHLVVIRADDLSYLHVHPAEGATPVFAVSGLAPGRYRYFFDFKVDGVVRTAAFTVDVGHGMPMGSEEHDHG